MVKIGFPREFSKIKALFPEKEKERDLYIVAENTENSEILGAVRFLFHDNQVDIFEMIMTYDQKQSMDVFDGIIRTLLFKMAEDGCTILAVHGAAGELEKYFIDHEFIEESDALVHKNYPAEFFKPCAGCSE